MPPSLWLLAPRPGAQEHLLWPAAPPLPPGTIEEAGTFTLELRDTPDALRSQRPDRARWRWSPGFYSGSVSLQLDLPSEKKQLFEAAVDPDRRKLTREAFDQMLGDILEDSLALFAISSFRKSVGTGTGRRPPPLARLEYLLSRLPRITAVVSSIADRPQRQLRASTAARPWHQARGVTAPELLHSLRLGRVLQERRTPSRLPGVLRGQLPATIHQKRRQDVFDTPEHRAILSTLRRWTGLLQSMAGLLEAGGRTAATDVQRRLQQHWASRSASAARGLHRLSALPVFQGLPVSDVTLHATATFRRVPAYRDFLRLHREFSLGLVDITGDFLQLPVSQTFQLYELWCFLRLVRAASSSGLLLAGATDSLFGSPDMAGPLVVATGSEVLIPLRDGQVLAFQKRFREYWLESAWLNGAAPRGTYSREMRPDITLASTSGLVVLDSKYRIAAALGDALSSIHTYRDAIVSLAEPTPAFTPGTVLAAYLLSPFLPGSGIVDPWPAVAMPGRLFHPQYRTDFRFGAITFRPGMTLPEIVKVLQLILQDAAV